MKKISIIVLIMIMFLCSYKNIVWLKVVNNNIDEYLDKII